MPGSGVAVAEYSLSRRGHSALLGKGCSRPEALLMIARMLVCCISYVHAEHASVELHSSKSSINRTQKLSSNQNCGGNTAIEDHHRVLHLLFPPAALGWLTLG